MISECANPDCGKPLHYLRDGRVFLLQVQASDNMRGKRTEHFWLCGACSPRYDVRQAGLGIELVSRERRHRPMMPLVEADAA